MKLIEQIDIQPQTAKWLFDLHKNSLITVDDSFQRNYVWLTKHQVKLIESILIGYPIPEIYLWNTGIDSNSGDTVYSIIDGQQRIGAIFQFIKNGYKLTKSDLDPQSPIYKDVSDLFFKDLEDKYKKAIWSYVFSVRIVRTQVSREEIVSMFLRLNSNNMTLNPQELRNAEFEGHFLKLANDLSELPFWEQNGIFTKSDIRRMRDITFISNILVFIRFGIEEDITARNINKVYQLFNEKYPNKKRDREMFIAVVNEIERVIDKEPLRMSFLSRKVHFYTLFNFIYVRVLQKEKLMSVQLDTYRVLIDNYDNETKLRRYFKSKINHVLEYQSLSKEGTNQKTNRIRRFELIELIMS